jgi:AraC-like DNA-binding protein
MSHFPDDQSNQLLAKFLDVTPHLEIIAPHPQQSFRSFTHDYPSEICGWHCHPEYEIHFIRETSGSMIAGDFIGTFEAGQVSIMGPNLPHDWVSDLDSNVVIPNRDAVIQFSASWLNKCIALIPELNDLENFLSDSSRGIMLSGDSAQEAGALIMEVIESRGSEKISRMFSLLAFMKNSPTSDKKILASEWFGNGSDEGSQAAVEAGLNYIFESLTSEIRLSTAAKLAFMSEATFSKYFKRAAGITFSDMVKKLRIAHACRMLDATDASISTVCAASGYNNIANFNRQFLAEMGMTPTAYRKLDSTQKPDSKILSRGIRGVPSEISA